MGKTSILDLFNIFRATNELQEMVATEEEMVEETTAVVMVVVVETSVEVTVVSLSFFRIWLITNLFPGGGM